MPSRPLDFGPAPGVPREALPLDAEAAARREGRFDVVVVGAGHAGCEAAHAAARMGLSVALLTVKLEDTAKMSCNPAIGGVAKGHMVRELDALGGLMGRITDQAGIQFKVLNRGRGPAVWSPRAQCDKRAYSAAMLAHLAATPGLAFVSGTAERVRVGADGCVEGLELADGRVLSAGAVVITPGTFLDGVMHVGETRVPGGRIGEHAALALSRCLGALGLERGGLTTGTPPRLLGDRLDSGACAEAPGDEPPRPFSHWTTQLELVQAMCWTTHTNEATHAVIRDNMARSPLYSGAIEGVGPRYCPSLEDKVVKFPERTAHHLFLEPEGRDSEEIYVNGVSTSMPADVQLEFLRTISGLEQVTMTKVGYAIEYDYYPPHQLDHTLQVRHVPGLWLAGQICGTSGYEEAAAQGLMAGINAARRVRGEPALVLRRDEAYIGVLVDDLVTREHREPYRMFTSAAEHRLILRADNADERLAATGHAMGLLSAAQLERVRARYAAIEAEEQRLARTNVHLPGEAPRSGLTARDWLARPGSTYAALDSLGTTPMLEEAEGEALEVRLKYRGYIERQQRAAERAAAAEREVLAEGLWQGELRGISHEGAEKLRRWRPRTLAQAGRIAGVSPSDVAVLMVLARRAAREPAASGAGLAGAGAAGAGAGAAGAGAAGGQRGYVACMMRSRGPQKGGRGAPPRTQRQAPDPRRSRLDPGVLIARQRWSLIEPFIPGDDAARAVSLERLREYGRMLLDWNQGVSNLISRHDEMRLVERHMRESVEPAGILIASGCRRFLDLGSGAGLPAIPLLLCGVGTHWTAVESRRNKTLFMRKVKQDMAVDNIDIVTSRLETLIAEAASPLEYDGFTSRATMTLGPTLAMASQVVTGGGKAFLWKGSSHEEEREAGRGEWEADWTFDAAHPIGEGPTLVCVFTRNKTS